MDINVLSADEVQALAVESLGLDSGAVDLTTVEGMAASLRRAAGFLCPCSSRTLVHGVVEPLLHLVDDIELVRESCSEVLEALMAHGDLLELTSNDSEEGAARRALIHTASPSFVRRGSGVLMVLGIVPDSVSILPDEIEQYLEYSNHVRLLFPGDKGDYAEQLLELGWVELSMSAWMKAPQPRPAARSIARFDSMLESASPCGEISGLLLLDPEQSVRYYRGRWVGTSAQTGRFVVRRPQA